MIFYEAAVFQTIKITQALFQACSTLFQVGWNKKILFIPENGLHTVVNTGKSLHFSGLSRSIKQAPCQNIVTLKLKKLLARFTDFIAPERQTHAESL